MVQCEKNAGADDVMPISMAEIYAYRVALLLLFGSLSIFCADVFNATFLVVYVSALNRFIG